MQYILTQEEYANLRCAQSASLHASMAELQELCTAAANHVPVPTPDWAGGDNTPEPWGCRNDPNSNNYDGYCDNCPAKNICPSMDKEFSK